MEDRMLLDDSNLLTEPPSVLEIEDEVPDIFALPDLARYIVRNCKENEEDDLGLRTLFEQPETLSKSLWRQPAEASAEGTAGSPRAPDASPLRRKRTY